MFTRCLGAQAFFCFSLAAEESELLTGKNLASSSLQLFFGTYCGATSRRVSVLGRMGDGGQARPRAVGPCELGSVVIVSADDRSFIAQQVFRGTQCTPAVPDGEGYSGCRRHRMGL